MKGSFDGWNPVYLGPPGKVGEKGDPGEKGDRGVPGKSGS